MAELRTRKQKLEKDIEELEESFGKRASKIQRKVKNAVRPVSYVRRNPIKSVCAAVLAGFVLGAAGGRKRSAKTSNSTSYSEPSPVSESSPKSTLTTFLLHELKHFATKKAMRFATDYIEHKIASAADNNTLMKR